MKFLSYPTMVPAAMSRPDPDPEAGPGAKAPLGGTGARGPAGQQGMVPSHANAIFSTGPA